MTTADLIKGCKKGKPKCQRELVFRFAPMLLTVCRRYVGERSLAEDALQETFMRIFKYIDQYKATGSFEAWMRRIAVNASLQFMEKAWYQREVELPENWDEGDGLPGALATLGAEELLELIQALPTGFRIVFNLYALEGYSHKEISQLLGITESASRSQLTRARKQLAQAVAQSKTINYRA